MEQEHKQRFKPNHEKCTINAASSSSSSSSSSQDDEDNDNDIVCQSLSLSPSLEEDLTHCLIMLSSSGNKDKDKQYKKKKKKKRKGVFECKACKKVFTSYQALGGHRASHKYVKGCFAVKLYNQDNEKIIGNELPMKKKKAKINMHECSICHRVFSSGQALGGHKRCHWITMSNTIEFMKVNIDVPVLLPLMPNKIGSEIFLGPWMEKKKNIFMSDDDEIGCDIKLAKLSESSSWLQMGIGSSTNDDA